MQDIYTELAELRRLIDNIVRYGTIAEIDYEEKRVRVHTGGDDEVSPGNTTDWIQWSADCAGETTDWNPPSLGEQVTILSTGGIISAGTAFRGKYSDAFPAPSSSPTLHKRQFPDGAVIEYDHGSHDLKITLPGGSSTRIKTDLFVVDAQNSVFMGDVLVYGKQTNNQTLTVNQSLSVLGQGSGGGESVSIAGTVRILIDAIIGGIPFLGHRHKVPAGGGLSEEPQ